MSSAEEYVAGGDSGASKTFPIQAGALKKGMHCVIKTRPCKIIEYTTSKTGKHGHAKAHIVATDIFTNKKLEEICPTSHNMEAPKLTRTEYTLLDITHEGMLSLLTADGDVREDLSMPTDADIAKAVQKGWDEKKELILTVVGAMDEEAVASCKESSNINNRWEAKKELVLTVVGAMDEEAVASCKEATK